MKRTCITIATTVLCIGVLTGCGSKSEDIDATEETIVEITTETLPEEAPVIEGIDELTIEGPDYDLLKNLPVPETEPAPEYLREGVEHEKVEDLQLRLMELGFMENDEPTEYYGSVTVEAVKSFQRQNGLEQDGIVGPGTWDAIMDPDAKFYAAQNGDYGEDIRRIQQRLYELGYLASEDMITGNYGDITEEAVRKLQEVNGLYEDGKVGRQTLNLLYSEDVKPNMLVYGEESDLVKAAQEQLKSLGYLTTEPDGKYGDDTAVAIKQFQSRNDLVVDGYLGPSTRLALNSSNAVPNGLSLGDENDAVTQVQKLLADYGYLSSANITGYFGELTETAVKNFQKNNGLDNDGSVGVLTMAKLTGSSVTKANGSSGTSSGKASSGVSNLLSIAASKLGCKYVYGAKGPNTFDCSGFVYWCLNQAGVKQSYLTSSGWRNVGKYTKVSSYNNLQAGDIIVVSGHVGICGYDGTVYDASSSNGKVVHRSRTPWWRNNFIVGWRIFG